MPALVICKSDEDSIKYKIAIVRTTFSEVYGPSWAGNSLANSRKWAKIDFIRNFMHVLVIRKFDEDAIKNEVTIIRSIFIPLYVHGRLNDLHMNSPICPEIELAQDFMSVLITCKSDEESNKIKIAIIRNINFLSL